MTGIHTRKFGVEIECGIDGGSERARSLLSHRNKFSPPWNVGYDGSGVEARSPILQGPAGFRELKRAYEVLVANGAYITIADGMHVHHDAPEFRKNPLLCEQLVDSWMTNQVAIYEMVAPWRRGSTMCPKWSPQDRQRLSDWAAQLNSPGTYFPGVGRKDLNLSALNRHGSIEIRLHEGTLDFEVARAWIMFGQRFISSVLTEPPKVLPKAQREELLRNLRLSKSQQAILEAKIRREHKDPLFQGPNTGKATGYRH